MDKSKLVTIILIVVVLAAGGVWIVYQKPFTQTAAEEACINSGGKVVKASCCASASDFPIICGAVGACGCSPENSKVVKSCNCPVGYCFNGNACEATAEGISGF